MTPDVPTLEEILGGLDVTPEVGGFSYEEIQELTGYAPARVRRLVKEAIRRGKLTAHRTVRPAETRPGYNVSCTVFRVVD